jgi:hypothetical protein
VAVAYLVVPRVARLLAAAGGYGPAVYEPKDAARLSWLDARIRLTGLPALTVEHVINVGLFLLVVVLWVAVVSARRR